MKSNALINLFRSYLRAFYFALREIAAYYIIRFPDTVQWAITGGCNSKCIFCEAPQLGTQRDMSTDEVLHIIDQMAELKIMHIHITGGEPFFRKDIFHILSYLKEKGFIVTVTTNGLCLEDFDHEQINTLKRLDPCIRLSIDSTDSKEYQAIRGIDGLKRIISGIRRLKYAGIRIKITTVICNINYHQISNIVQLAKDLDIGIIEFQPVSAESAFAFIPKRTDKARLMIGGDYELIKLKEYIDKGIDLSRRLKVSTNLPMFRIWAVEYFRCHLGGLSLYPRYFDRIISLFICKAVTRHIFIDYDGSIKPCLLGKPVGNIKEASLKELINRLKDLERRLRERKFPSFCDGCFCHLQENIIFSTILSPLINYKWLKPIWESTRS
jgi:MoaA/NifB/PqqE/SkfB family radical SAM enzyme